MSKVVGYRCALGHEGSSNQTRRTTGRTRLSTRRTRPSTLRAWWFERSDASDDPSDTPDDWPDAPVDRSDSLDESSGASARRSTQPFRSISYRTGTLLVRLTTGQTHLSTGQTPCSTGQTPRTARHAHPQERPAASDDRSAPQVHRSDTCFDTSDTYPRELTDVRQLEEPALPAVSQTFAVANRRSLRTSATKRLEQIRSSAPVAPAARGWNIVPVYSCRHRNWNSSSSSPPLRSCSMLNVADAGMCSLSPAT
jgi:hypothetical protein